MEKHINVVGILWIVSGVLGLLLAVSVFGILIGVSFLPDVDSEASLILRWVGLGSGLFLAALSVPDIIGGIWLMKREEWARILVLVLAFLNLIWFPLGTAIGVYSLIVLLREDTAKLFK